MSKYTMELRELFTPIKFNPPLYTKSQVEGFFEDYELTDFLTTEQISVISNAGIWSKDKLAKKIVDHYYMREIGQETIGLFKHYAKVSMQEIMEEYLPIIYSASIQYDPLINVNYSEQFYRTASVDSSGSSNSSGLGVASDTPQGQISKTAILAGAYASSTSANENAVSSSSGSDTSENYTKTIRGNSGVSATSQKMIEQYRDNIRAIDREIIEKLEPLFMGLY